MMKAAGYDPYAHILEIHLGSPELLVSGAVDA